MLGFDWECLSGFVKSYNLVGFLIQLSPLQGHYYVRGGVPVVPYHLVRPHFRHAAPVVVGVGVQEGSCDAVHVRKKEIIR